MQDRAGEIEILAACLLSIFLRIVGLVTARQSSYSGIRRVVEAPARLRPV